MMRAGERMKRKTFICSLLLTLLFTINVVAQDTRLSGSIDINNMDTESIKDMVDGVLSKSKVPGVSIVLVNGDQTKYLNFGSADIGGQIDNTSETLFELGSMSKSFTALGVLLLEDKGLLKLNDPVSKYLPWFHVYYKGEHDGLRINDTVELTLSNLLYHTSGIPFKTIGDIPEGTSDDMLEKTIRNLVGIHLDYYPGDRFQYATINYDVLALIMQKITGQSYEQFMNENILDELGLHNTYLFLDKAQNTGSMAKGHKMSFFSAIEYNAPRYRGNTPAGYLISNTQDMEHWLRIQLGLVDLPEQYKRIVARSKDADTTVASQGNNYYAGGWFVNNRGTEIQHGGSNPNFSSYILLKPASDMGICVLSNMNSNASEFIAKNTINILEGKKVEKYSVHTYKRLDMLFSVITVASVIVCILYLVFLIITCFELVQKKRLRTKLKGVKVAGIILAVPIMAFLGFCIYYLPNILFDRLAWKTVNVWGSPFIMIGCISGFVTCVIFMVYVLLTFNFPKKNDKSYLGLIPLSLINGISSALIIFTINETFNRNLEYSRELLVYFVFSLLFFIYTIKLLQGRMIIITNEIAYEKRISMINKIMSSSFQSIEMIGKDRIFSGLNNDCAEVAKVPGMIVNFASNLLTLIFCLSYLFTKSVYVFIVSLGIILVNGLLGYITGRIASKYWEKNRDIQDTFFSQMSDLVNGFKELALNKYRRYAFWQDMEKYSKLSTELNKEASIKFLNFSLYNMLMYNIVFGVVVFIIPLFVLSLNVNQLREHLFIVFYMIGPFRAIVGGIPYLTQLNVNVKRINRLIKDLEDVSTVQDTITNIQDTDTYKDIKLELNNVVFKYVTVNKDTQREENEFTLGPLSIEFNTNEIVYITGGNGSGKSTLGKIITGLYEPQSGEIKVNNEKVDLHKLNDLFSSVYSDFKLFKKLYGIDYQKKKEDINKYLNMMEINEKVEINEEGEFKSIDLSTGQKKRLAFAVSCLEDKPMMIYDEWAAEQDPHFRKYFYENLLPMLKEMGKGVIVITHDDRYFNMADKLVKLERGELLETKIKELI